MNTENTSKSKGFKLKGYTFDYFNYKYPNCDSVPGGWYVSEVMHIKGDTSKKGNDAIMVYYKIEPYYEVYKQVNGIIPADQEIKAYYVKQMYEIDSDYYSDFIDSMNVALGLPRGSDIDDSNDIISVTERVKLEYFDWTEIGGFTYRVPLFEEDLIQSTDSSN